MRQRAVNHDHSNAKRLALPWGGLDTPRMTLMDRRGNGVPIILERSRRLSGIRPAYELLGDAELRLTIFAAGHDDSDRS